MTTKKDIKCLQKRIIEQDLTIQRQKDVIKTQQETLQFILSGKPLWKLLLT